MPAERLLKNSTLDGTKSAGAALASGSWQPWPVGRLDIERYSKPLVVQIESGREAALESRAPELLRSLVQAFCESLLSDSLVA